VRGTLGFSVPHAPAAPANTMDDRIGQQRPPATSTLATLATPGSDGRGRRCRRHRGLNTCGGRGRASHQGRLINRSARRQGRARSIWRGRLVCLVGLASRSRGKRSLRCRRIRGRGGGARRAGGRGSRTVRALARSLRRSWRAISSFGRLQLSLKPEQAPALTAQTRLQLADAPRGLLDLRLESSTVHAAKGPRITAEHLL